MSKKSRNKEFNFSFTHIVRWLIFGFICYTLVNYLSVKPTPVSDPTTVLGESTPTITIPDSASISTFLDSRLNSQQKQQVDTLLVSISSASSNLPAFVNQQVTNIKKDFLTQLYQELLKGLDKK